MINFLAPRARNGDIFRLFCIRFEKPIFFKFFATMSTSSILSSFQDPMMATTIYRDISYKLALDLKLSKNKI
jgi:hypothetical protein